MEWDSYIFSVDPLSGLDLAETNPSPQPIVLSPNTSQSVVLYLSAENSLSITVLDVDTGEPVFNADTRLYNVGLGYDVTQYTSDKGQTYFIPLEINSYELEIQAVDFITLSGAERGWRVSSNFSHVLYLENMVGKLGIHT